MTALRSDLAIIAREVRDHARILDVGCGDGLLMAALRDTKNVDARGMELNARDVATAVAFLASPAARQITGAVLTVDGGAIT